MRGFTLLEFVVTVVLTAAVFALVLAWVMNLGVVATMNLETASAARQARAVSSTLSSDLQRAVACADTGTPVHLATSTMFSVFTDDPASSDPAAVSLVTWRLSGGRLERSAVAASVAAGQCAVVAPGVDASVDPDAASWVLFSSRASVERPSRPDAVALFSDQVPAGARVMSAELSLAAADSTSAPAAVRVSAPLFAAYQGLS